VFVLLLGRGVDAVVTGGPAAAGWPLLLPWIAAAALGRALAAWAGDAFAHSAAGHARTALRSRLVGTLLRLGPAGVAGERTGELTNTLVGGVDSVEAYVSQFLPQAILAITVPIAVLAVVLALDPLSGAVLAVTGPLIPLFMWLIGGAAQARTRQQFVTLSRMSARFLDAVQALPLLKAFGRTGDETAAIARASERFRSVTLSVLRVAFLSALTLELLATISVAIVAVEVGLRLLYARLPFRDAFTVLVLAPEFYRPLRSLGAAFHAGLAGREALARIRALGDGDEPPDVIPAPRIASGPAAAGSPEPGPRRPPPRVTFDQVSFSYHRAGQAALRGVSLEIPPGRTLALVGPSGSGKTTLARLLLRFIEPDEGSVRVNGRPLEALDADAWRRQVAWVPQQPHLFYGTVRENLLIARPDASPGAMWVSLACSGADAFVRALPRGLDTPLGERGQRLSGGQAQRIALARAFLKDAPLLILDEPTAQLDPGQEASIHESMAALAQGRSVLLIAHRLTTVARADAIAVISNGRVVEHGTPAALAAAAGPYSAMVRAYGGAR
jgi:thiol reductant ABC exporter CydD subunit